MPLHRASGTPRPGHAAVSTYPGVAVLRSARLLGAEEAMKLLSRVRLGLHLGRLPEVDPAVVNQLFLQIQPAHLQHDTTVPLSPDELRAARASLVRERLS